MQAASFVGTHLSNDTWSRQHTLLTPLSEFSEYDIIFLPIEHITEAHAHYLDTVHFMTVSFYYFFYFFLASSVLSTIPSPPTLSGANNTTPENVNTTPEDAPPTTRTTAASSTEKPIGNYSFDCR